MKILKEFHEFNRYRERDMEELIGLHFNLAKIENDLLDEIDNLEPFEVTTNHEDLQKNYTKFSVLSQLNLITYRINAIKNYIDFVHSDSKKL